MNACMHVQCVCMYVCMCMCMRVRAVCVYVRACVCLYVDMYTVCVNEGKVVLLYDVIWQMVCNQDDCTLCTLAYPTLSSVGLCSPRWVPLLH